MCLYYFLLQPVLGFYSTYNCINVCYNITLNIVNYTIKKNIIKPYNI